MGSVGWGLELDFANGELLQVDAVDTTEETVKFFLGVGSGEVRVRTPSPVIRVKNLPHHPARRIRRGIPVRQTPLTIYFFWTMAARRSSSAFAALVPMAIN